MYKHLVCEKFLYWAQFCFKTRVSKEEITSLIARVNEFLKKLMILFWEFPRPFKSFWHHRSKYNIKNLKIYGITSINYDCLSNYVTEKIIHSSKPQITNYYWKYTTWSSKWLCFWTIFIFSICKWSLKLCKAFFLNRASFCWLYKSFHRAWQHKCII